jgi:hypothetical protein
VGFAENLEQIFDVADHPERPDCTAEFDDFFGRPFDLPRRGRGGAPKLEEDSISFESQAEFFALLDSL